MDKADVERYSRQMLLPGVGADGQKRLLASRVLVVGAGGLGAPTIIYLATAGIGCIGVLDHDTVDESNLHRQVIHDESSVGMSKVESVVRAVGRMNSRCRVETHQAILSSANALDILSKYDLIIDATDNAPTRYLLNDACVLLGKVLVTGSALGFEGQLTVYGLDDGPCMRCVFPTPPPPETVSSCENSGVMGMVTGTIGSLMALEAVKIIAQFGETLRGRLLLFDGLSCTFRNVRLRGRQPSCPLCGTSPTQTSLVDYEAFCGSKATEKSPGISLVPASDRMSAAELKAALGDTTSNADEHVALLDVRPAIQFGMCAIPGSFNVPRAHLEARFDEVRQWAGDRKVHVICRRGNESQRAVVLMRAKGLDAIDVVGGVNQWAREVDETFPLY